MCFIILKQPRIHQKGPSAGNSITGSRGGKDRGWGVGDWKAARLFLPVPCEMTVALRTSKDRAAPSMEESAPFSPVPRCLHFKSVSHRKFGLTDKMTVWNLESRRLLAKEGGFLGCSCCCCHPGLRKSRPSSTDVSSYEQNSVTSDFFETVFLFSKRPSEPAAIG